MSSSVTLMRLVWLLWHRHFPPWPLSMPTEFPLRCRCDCKYRYMQVFRVQNVKTHSWHWCLFFIAKFSHLYRWTDLTSFTVLKSTWSHGYLSFSPVWNIVVVAADPVLIPSLAISGTGSPGDPPVELAVITQPDFALAFFHQDFCYKQMYAC